MGKYVLAAVDDMFFAAKIRATAEQLGLDVRFAKSAEDVLEKARRGLRVTNHLSRFTSRAKARARGGLW